MLKLKWKLQFKSHIYFEAVRPAFIEAALTWLKESNNLYKDVVIDCANISNQLTDTVDDVSSPSNYNDTSLTIEALSKPDITYNDTTADPDNVDKETPNEEQEDPLNEHRSPANETCLQAIFPDYPVILDENDCNVSTGREIYNVAPGENKHPVSLMTDKLCEELAFPFVSKRSIRVFC